jgi:cytochrome c oxidase subunit 2
MQPTASRSRLRGVLRVGVPLLLIALLGGCLLPPEPKTEAAKDVFNLYLLVLALAAIVFVGVEGFILYAIFRYRRKPGDDALPPQLHGNNTIEVIWTLIPTVIVFVLFVFSMITLGEVEASDEDPGVTIQVDGFQWQWTFRYPDGGSVTGSAAEPPVLAVPVGEPVRLVLNSLDVNHAFYVPQFLIKRDLIPVGENGEPNELTFTVSEAGTYSGQCAEFCGTAHADMTFVVEAMERAAYDEYVAALAAGEEPGGGGGGECATTVQLSAANIQFDTDALEVPAGEDFCIEFTNDDTVPHDVGIEETGFNGDNVAPGESITYVIPALEAGDYTFYCTLHPSMVGDLTVTE